MGTPKITVQCGSDYMAVWKGDEQIYCYHVDTVGRCFQKVVEALGGELEVTEFEECLDFAWDSVDGITLSEFRRMCAESKAKRLREELKQAKDLVKGLEATLKALGVDE